MFSLLIRRDGLIEPPKMTEVDHHCHILPGLDDGADSDETSIAIAHLLLELGVRKVVATPHVISDIYPNTTGAILDAVDTTRRLFEEERLPLDIEAGAEYYVEAELLNRIDNNDIISFGEERYVMFESPLSQKPMLFEEVVFSLKSAGYTPVLAHAERYRFLQGNNGEIETLRRMGLKFQVNHPSFHLPKTSTKGEMARRLSIKGMVDLFGTDIHKATSDDQALASKGDKRLFARLNSR
jgi:protein-tyrosine phosphatase